MNLKKGYSMQPISTTFTDRQFSYTQIEREGNIAIYAQQYKDNPKVTRYEVVRLRVVPPTTWPNGDVSPEREVYPSSSQWGTMGWTCFSLPEAQALARMLH